MLDHVLALARQGFHVFPLRPRGKVPLLAERDGGHGHLDATMDEALIRSWWRRCPEANIGLRPDGLVVVDIDPRHGGNASMQHLVDEHGRLPVTLVSRTAGGGLHYFFRLPSTPVRQGAGVLGAGVDTRVDRLGYVVAPPSFVIVAPTAKEPGYHGSYQWLRRVEPAPSPPWLAQLLSPPPEVRRPVLEHRAAPPVDVAARALAWIRWQADRFPSIQGQNGSGKLAFAAAGLVVGFQLSEAHALDLLTAVFNPASSPPWSPRELARAVKRAPRLRHFSPGSLLNAPRRAA